MLRLTTKMLLLTSLVGAGATYSLAETHSAQDMAKECRVAVDLFQGHVEKNFENTLFAGECIGYIQGAGDVSLAMADNVKWFKACIPDSASTMALIQKFIAFVDKNPKYTLASTAFQLMLAEQYPCNTTKTTK
jgi:predicted secreted protein